MWVWSVDTPQLDLMGLPCMILVLAIMGPPVIGWISRCAMGGFLQFQQRLSSPGSITVAHLAGEESNWTRFWGMRNRDGGRSPLC
jgi:hypothetical protein